MSLNYQSTKLITLLVTCLTVSITHSACETLPPPNNQSHLLADSFEAKANTLFKAGTLTTEAGKFRGTIETKTIELSGSLHKNAPNYATWKGTVPNLMYYANCDNSVDIAWHDSKTGKINIIQIDSEGNVAKSFELKIKEDELPSATTNLLGFTKIPSDGSYAVAYGKTENYTFKKDNEALVPEGTVQDIGHYYLARFNASGKNIWTNHLFGYDHAKKHGGLFNPGSNATARLEYDERIDALTYYVGVNGRTGRLQVHQASTWGIYSTSGEYLTSHRWYVSHNYEQRILFDGDNTYYFGHGDNRPYGLFVGIWKFTKPNFVEEGKSKVISEKLVRGAAYAKYRKYLKLNKTNHALGDVVRLGDGKFAAVYAKGKDDFHPDAGNYNVYFRNLDTNGKNEKERNANIQKFNQNIKLTNSEKTKDHSGIARVARYDKNLIIAWHHSTKPYAYIGEYDIQGKAIVKPKMIDNVLLNPMFGMITLPNGNVFWASSKKNGGNQLMLNWIKK